MATAQSADELAIPVRKNGNDSQPAQVASSDAPASAEKSVARRVTSRLRDDASPSNADEAQATPPGSAASAASSPVVESRLSLYNLDGANAPTGLLRKRTSGGTEAAPPQRRPSAEPAPRQSEPSRQVTSEREEPARPVRPERKPTRTESAKSDSPKSKSSNREVAEKRERSDESEIQQEANLAALNNLRQSDEEPAESAPETADSTMAAIDTAGAGLPQAPAPMMASVAPAPARVSQPAPNLYLPQSTPPQRSGGLFSRLFGRRGQQGTAAVQPAVMDFNSDYATRDDDAVCPVVLPGYGINGRDIPIGSEDQYRLTSSLPQNFRPTDLVQLPRQYTHYGNALYLRREAAASLCQMIATAEQQGLTIRAVSAFRDYDHQLRLYTQAVARGGENQKSVARPGRSEHYLGTTVDLTNNEQHCLKRSFGDTAEGRWLAANAGRFGWKMTVMSGEGRRSHNDEPWHLRYLGSAINNPTGISPIAQQPSQPQRRDVFGSIGRFLGLRR